MRATGLLLAATVLAASSMAQSRPAEARAWCLYLGNHVDNGTNCGFDTFAQCQITKNGIGGACVRNTDDRTEAGYPPEPARHSRRTRGSRR